MSLCLYVQQKLLQRGKHMLLKRNACVSHVTPRVIGTWTEQMWWGWLIQSKSDAEIHGKQLLNTVLLRHKLVFKQIWAC